MKKQTNAGRLMWVSLALIAATLWMVSQLAVATASREFQEPGTDAAQSELRALKQEIESAAASAEQLDRYRELLTRINSANPEGGKQRTLKRTPKAGPCMSGDLEMAGTTFNRPQISTAPPGFVQPGAISMAGTNVIYQAYEFNVTGCLTPSVTAKTCGTGNCSATGTLADSVLFVYQKSDASASTPGSPIFDPTAASTNLVAANDDFCGLWSQVTAGLMPGNFVVVVTQFSPSAGTGTYSLTVNVPGCTLVPAGNTCTITCPANITKSNDPNQCGAVTTYPAPTTTGTCGTVTCSPASGSFFPKGTTTVTCSTTAGPSCSFTVTVNDTQPPTITCPANQTSTAAQTCPFSNTATVSFPPPTASDNCPGVTTQCTPASGSTFPVGTTTVTCTATDTSGNTATCSFTVAVFSGCLQDDSNPTTVVLFNALTGDYRFCCNGTAFTGRGTVTIRGCIVEIVHNTADRRVLIKADFTARAGTASLQVPPGTTRCTITDRNTSNNTCQCGSGGVLAPPK